MAKNLVIVESPAKAATIERYLGSDYQVLASMGHVRDLPASKLGVDVDDAFVPTYVTPPKARKTIKALKDALKGKETVYLATDLDREGEAIAWHVAAALDLASQPKLTVRRITFDEITKDAIQHAVAHPRDLDLQLVDAQQARRVLDRLVGYTLSPILWKKIYKGLSAGRVQSVALRLVVERERERQAFNPVEYWSLQADLAAAEVPEFVAGLIEYAGKKIEQLTLQSGAEAATIVESLADKQFVVASLVVKRQKRHPLAPYTTSKLQQDGVNRLGMSARRVMQAAQRLYEAGHITYMRTDSVALASTAVAGLREVIVAIYGSDFLPPKAPVYHASSKGAQEAHEAIRPTHPENLQVSGDSGEQKLYDLIRRRTLASQMKDADIEVTTALVEAGKAVFRASGSRIVFPGFLSAWGNDAKESVLPKLDEAEILRLISLRPEQHFTEPPPRFTEASLIKKLEELGVGRPSTYAPTIGTLSERGYVRSEQRQLVPEEVGFTVTDLLVTHFANVVDSNFTATMEEELDKVATGQSGYAGLLGDFWTPFKKQIDENSDKIEKVVEEETTDELCPVCQAPMTVKRSRFGKFLACSRFPECRGTKSLVQMQPTGLSCPHCGKDLIEKRARRGVFYGCSGYPECTVALWNKEQLPAKVAELEAGGVEVPFKEQSLAQFSELGLEPKPIRPPRVAKVEVPKKKTLVKKKAPAKRKTALTSK
jgi:DNA topoisomerase-1